MRPKTVQCRHRRVALALIGICAAAAQPAAASGDAASAAGSDRRQQMASAKGTRPAAGAIEAHQLAPLFPAVIGPWKREQLGTPLPQPVPAPRPAMRSMYSQGDQRAEVTLHLGTPSGAAKGTRSVYSEVRPAKPDTLVTMTLPNGLQFAATSRTADAAALEALLRGLDLDRAETLKAARR